VRRRLLFWVGLPLLAIVLLGLAGKSWLLHSDSGARWIISLASTQLGDNLSLGTVSGNLDKGLILTQVGYHQDGLDVKVSRVEAQGEITLLPLKITIASLHAFDVEVRTLPSEAVDPGQSDSLQDILGGLSLPIDLDMQKLQITRLKVIDSSSELLFKLDSAGLSAYWSDGIVLNYLDISSEILQASVKGNIQFQPPFAHKLLVNAVVPGTGGAAGSGRFEANTEGTAERSTIEILSEDPAFTISGVIERPLDDANFDLRVSLVNHQFAGDVRGGGVLISDVVGKLTGLPNNYALQLQATVSGDGYSPVLLGLSGEGDLTSLRVSQMSATADFIEASASGEVSWAQPARFDLDVELQHLLPSIWMADWPDKNFIHGSVSVLSKESLIHVSRLDAQVAGTTVQVAGQAVVDPAENKVEATLNWKTLGWPIWQQPYLVSSDSGKLHMTGAPDDWQFAGDLDIQTPQYPGGSFKLEGHGSMEDAAVNIVNGQVLGGRVAGDANLNWSGPFNWNARLDVAKLDLEALVSDLPATVDAKVEVSQDTGQNAFVLLFEHLHANLGGVFKGQSLDGKGKVTADSSGLNFDGLQLRSENSSLLFDGNSATQQGIEFAVEVHSPDWVSAFLGGDISGRGRIALAASQPVIDLELEAMQMQWGDWQLKRLTITPLQADKTAGINLAIDIEGFTNGESGVESGHIELTGNKNRQVLAMKLVQGEYQFQSLLSGALSSWTSLADLDWSGDLEETQLLLRGEPLLTQNNASAIKFSAQAVELQQTCMTTVGEGGLCINTDWARNGLLEVDASLSTLPLSVTKLIFEHGIEFSQTLGGEFRWQQLPGKSPSGRLALNISAGEFGDELEMFDRVKTAEGFLGFELDSGNLTAGELRVPFPGIGQVDVNYSVSGLLLDGTGIVDGDVKIELNDISVMEGLVPELESFSGQLSSELKLSGVTSDPRLDGHVALLNASANIPLVGAQLRDVSLEGRVSSSDMAVLEGGFTAGEGKGQLKLTSSFSDWSSPQFSLNVSGENLRMLNTPEVRMDASTDTSLAWDSSGWTIGGWVLVQDAKITPGTLEVGRVTESEDVIIVQGEVPYGGLDKEEETVNLKGNLKVSLGDKVRVETDLAKTRLTGVVDLTWKKDIIPVADGAIQLNGTVSIFGPRLTLQDSQIRFINTPVNNPLLDIRAERDIYGNTQIRTAGVSISGSAKRPEIDAYTVPDTTSDRAWALLITGNDVDYGQSVGALELGTYVAPKLYLSYGISLLNNGNVFSARYDLKKGFGIKASSGQRESGVDISYTIDR
jgi:translocation and assembly module TamB